MCSGCQELFGLEKLKVCPCETLASPANPWQPPFFLCLNLIALSISYKGNPTVFVLPRLAYLSTVSSEFIIIVTRVGISSLLGAKQCSIV